MKTELLQVKISPEQKEDLKKLATKNGMSMSSYVCMMIAKAKFEADKEGR